MFYPACALKVFLADQYLKKQMDEWLGPRDTREIWDGNIILRKHHNEGMAFHALSKSPILVRVLNAASVLVTAVFWFHLLRQKGYRGLKLGLSLILGGGVSNLYDRFTKGYVIDYFSFKCPNKDLEKLVFNLADVFVFLGGLIVLLSSKTGKQSGKEKKVHAVVEVEEKEV